MTDDGGRWTAARLRAAAFVTSFDRFAMPPVLVSAARDLDVPLGAVAGAAGAYFLAYGLMQPVCGIAADRLGTARIMRWGVGVGAVGAAVTALAPDLATLTVGRVVASIGFAAAFPSTLVYLGATVPWQGRQRAVSRLLAGVALGTASGTVVGGVLAATTGWRGAFVASAVLALLTAWLLRSLTELPLPARRPLWVPAVRVLRDPAVRLLLLLVAVEGAGLLGALTFVPSAVEAAGDVGELGPAVAAAPAALYGLAVLVAAGVVGRLSDRVPLTRFCWVGGLLGLAGSGVLAVDRSPVAAGVACLLLGLCWASLHGSLQAWATEVAPDERSAAVTFFAGSLFAGTALTAAVGGGLADDGAYPLLFAGCAVLTGLVGVAAALARRRWERGRSAA